MTEKKTVTSASAFWQVTLPVIASFLVVLGLGIWLILAGSRGTVLRLAEISTVFLVIPVLFFSLIPLVILGALVYGVSRLIGGLPNLTGKILSGLETVREWVGKFSDAAVEPIIKPVSWWGGIQTVLKRETPVEEDIILNPEDSIEKAVKGND